MKEQREVEENCLAQQTPWLMNNVRFCYDGDSPANNDSEKKQRGVWLASRNITSAKNNGDKYADFMFNTENF